MKLWLVIRILFLPDLPLLFGGALMFYWGVSSRLEIPLVLTLPLVGTTVGWVLSLYGGIAVLRFLYGILAVREIISVLRKLTRDREPKERPYIYNPEVRS